MATLNQHVNYSNNPELFMKEQWVAFDAFETKVIKTLTPFEYQLEFIKNIHNTNHHIAVKSRQMHIGSMMALYIAWYVIFNQDKTVLIIGSTSEAATKILSQVNIILKHYSVDGVFNEEDDFKINTKTMLTLKNGCRIRAKSQSTDAGRGETAHFLYIDEAAYIKNFEMLYAGVAVATMCQKNSKIIIASTPKDNSFFNKMYLNSTNGSFNPLKLHWCIHPFYSKGIQEDRRRESPYQFTSPWFEDMVKRIYRDSVSIVEQELECVVKYNEETNKVKTISLRVDSDFHKKIQDRLNPGESVSDYIRSLVEKDLRYYL